MVPLGKSDISCERWCSAFYKIQVCFELNWQPLALIGHAGLEILDSSTLSSRQPAGNFRLSADILDFPCVKEMQCCKYELKTIHLCAIQIRTMLQLYSNSLFLSDKEVCVCVSCNSSSGFLSWVMHLELQTLCTSMVIQTISVHDHCEHSLQ